MEGIFDRGNPNRGYIPTQSKQGLKVSVLETIDGVLIAIDSVLATIKLQSRVYQEYTTRDTTIECGLGSRQARGGSH